MINLIVEISKVDCEIFAVSVCLLLRTLGRLAC